MAVAVVQLKGSRNEKDKIIISKTNHCFKKFATNFKSKYITYNIQKFFAFYVHMLLDTSELLVTVLPPLSLSCCLRMHHEVYVTILLM